MTETYQAPVLTELGSFAMETGFGIGFTAEGPNPIADRPL